MKKHVSFMSIESAIKREKVVNVGIQKEPYPSNAMLGKSAKI